MASVTSSHGARARAASPVPSKLTSVELMNAEAEKENSVNSTKNIGADALDPTPKNADHMPPAKLVTPPSRFAKVKVQLVATKAHLPMPSVRLVAVTVVLVACIAVLALFPIMAFAQDAATCFADIVKLVAGYKAVVAGVFGTVSFVAIMFFCKLALTKQRRIVRVVTGKDE